MHRKITLDLDSIHVASFDTSAGERHAVGLDLITKHTGSPCCDGTVCVTLSECSSERCA